jgi:hypothetical protein
MRTSHYLSRAACWLIWLLCLTTAHAEKNVYVDVNFVAVKSPGSGLFYGPKLDSGLVNNNNSLADTFLTSVNAVMLRSGRGLLFRRLGNIQYKTLSLGDTDSNGTDDIDQITAAEFAKGFVYTFVNNAEAPANRVAYGYFGGALNFHMIPSMNFGLGFSPDNAVIQGGFKVDPGTHEMGHWFTLPHPFRANSDPGYLYWGDSESPEEHGDGFTDTLIDYVGPGVVTLDDSAAKNFTNANGPPVTYASLTVPQKTVAQTWFRDHYAKAYFGAISYNALTSAQQLRIPPYDTAAPLPVATDRERLAIHVYGAGFDSLTTVEQNGITSAIAAPSAAFYIQDARKSVWYCKVDDDLIARHNFGRFHDELNAWEQDQIRLLNANVASYRTGKSSPYSVFSEQQLDRMCDIISQPTDGRDRSPTRATRSGKYIFFGGPTTVPSAPSGSSLRPMINIANAHAAVTAYSSTNFPEKADIIIGRPGTYPVPGPNGTLRINKPCTIRATNAGAFSIVGQ